MVLKVKTFNVNPKLGYLTRIWFQIKYSLMWYCDKTSLHGFHYITNTKSSAFTRLFFACTSCCSLLLCSYLIMLQLVEHQQGSIITTIKSTTYPVWKVRFPSVTICNFNVVYRDNMKKVLNMAKIHGFNERVFTDMIYNLSSLTVHDDLEDMSGYKEVYDALNRVGYDTDKLMAELAQPCKSMVKKCFWQNQELPCSFLFKSVKTSQGYCCSFNYYGAQDMKHNIKNPQRQDHQYADGAGPTLGLRVLLDIEESQYISSIKPSYGLNVLVQDGADYPDMDITTNSLQAAQEVSLAITPKIYVSTEKFKHMTVEQRNCLFEHERDLESTSVYSFRTCINRCKARAISKYCGCVPYYYSLQKSRPICTLLDGPCLQANKYKYSALDIFENSETAEELRNRAGSMTKCNCYPQCNERMFDVTTNRAKAIPMVGYQFTNMSILNVYYNNIGCLRIERDIYFTWDRVFASIGGIFGLCLGGSVISVLECLYFFAKSIRNCCKTKVTKIVKRVEPHRIYINDFIYHHYRRNNFEKAANVHISTLATNIKNN